MNDIAVSQWSFEGDYFEICSCTVVCPCEVSTQALFTATPTEGVCDAGFAFHLDRGAFGDVSLDNLNRDLIAHIPGPMLEGNWAEMVAVNAHPFSPHGVVMAMGEVGSSWADWNLRWDNSGRNGHYSRIQWSKG